MIGVCHQDWEGISLRFQLLWIAYLAVCPGLVPGWTPGDGHNALVVLPHCNNLFLVGTDSLPRRRSAAVSEQWSPKR
eukprot:648105-Hanusia_phi.AAC.1